MTVRPSAVSATAKADVNVRSSTITALEAKEKVRAWPQDFHVQRPFESEARVVGRPAKACNTQADKWRWRTLFAMVAEGLRGTRGGKRRGQRGGKDRISSGVTLAKNKCRGRERRKRACILGSHGAD